MDGWMGGWVGGWVDGWMDGSKSRVKDCLQQSKILLPLFGNNKSQKSSLLPQPILFAAAIHI